MTTPMTQGDAVVAAAEEGIGVTLCRAATSMLGEMGVIVGKVTTTHGGGTLYNIRFSEEQVKRMAERYRREKDESDG